MTNSNKPAKVRIRMPQLANIPEILYLFVDEVEAGLMLPRKQREIQAGIQDWRAAYLNDEVVGCVSLVFYSKTLCEIRSLAVSKMYRKNGLGKNLVEAAIALAQERGAEKVFTLTRAPELFEKLGFRVNKIGSFPEKVQKDCSPCPFINHCEEISLVLDIEERGARS